MSSRSTERLWVVVPAAGSARRMGAALPKQYLQIAGKCVLEWSLAPFLARQDVAGIAVALSRADEMWSTLPCAADPRIVTVEGGAQRSDSVVHALRALRDRAADGDWILVHDAARPCLSGRELQRLIEAVSDHPVGGLLAAPVVDTLKRVDADGHVVATVARDNLWRALTPQMFRYEVLLRALERAAQTSAVVTDEAQAIEALGSKPLVVAGDPDNLKITLPEDLERAARVLEKRAGA